jgi:putative transposase
MLKTGSFSTGSFSTGSMQAMLLQPYSLEELHFAWSFRVYVRSRTYRRQQIKTLALLDSETLGQLLEPYDIKVLEFNAGSVDFRTLISLKVHESVSSAVSKLKGRISKWVNTQSIDAGQAKTLGRGYFAATTGKSTANDIAKYLDSQSQHHGYDTRVRPPVFVQTYERSAETESLLATDHAVTSIRFHIVLVTQWRHGVFAESTGRAVADCWKSTEQANRMFISKVSFVPDHVHVAVEMHPAVSPAEIVLNLMNSAQELMWTRFDDCVIQAKVTRLWQASAYVGSFGDLSSSALSAYVRKWEESS